MTQETEREAFEKAAQQFADEHLKDEMHILYYEVCAMAFKGGWQARARVGKGEVERDSISAEEIKGWRLDPKVHDAILNRADPFSVAWHQREKEHQAALSAQAKPVEVDTELTRLKRQVEVLRAGLINVKMHQESNVKSNTTALMGTTWHIATNAIAAADRIAKGEV